MLISLMLQLAVQRAPTCDVKLLLTRSSDVGMTSHLTRLAIGSRGKITPTSVTHNPTNFVFFPFTSCAAPNRAAGPGERKSLNSQYREGVRLRFVVKAEASHVGGWLASVVGLHESD